MMDVFLPDKYRKVFGGEGGFREELWEE